jgi:DNA-directed RNA polymerase specialized sigma24 family protein
MRTEAQAGNRRARDQVLVRCGPWVQDLVERRFGGVLERIVEAEDVAQEAFLRLHRDLDRFEDRGRGSFAA